MDQSPIEFLSEKYPEGIITTKGKQKMDIDAWRQVLGKWGITQDRQTRKMETMSPGFHSRMVLLILSLGNPHILLLDEPTNGLDMQSIDGLADPINNYSGGLVLLSHDFRLISKVAKEVWVCDRSVKPWKGDIQSYKKYLKETVMEGGKKMAGRE